MVIVIWCAIRVIVLNSMVRYIQWVLTSTFISHIIFYPLLCVCHYCAHPSIKSLWHLFGSYVQFRLKHNAIYYAIKLMPYIFWVTSNRMFIGTPSRIPTENLSKQWWLTFRPVSQCFRFSDRFNHQKRVRS